MISLTRSVVEFMSVALGEYDTDDVKLLVGDWLLSFAENG
jgi:hypothetical protein